jgi:hypothetical protein
MSQVTIMSITLDAKETKRWETDDSAEGSAFRHRIRTLARGTKRTEIYSADGIMLDYVEPLDNTND